MTPWLFPQPIHEGDARLIEEYLEFLRGQGVCRCTLWHVAGAVKALARYMAQKKGRVTTATADDLRKFLRKFDRYLRAKKRTFPRKQVMRWLRRIDRFYDFLLAEGRIRNRPRGVDMREKKPLDPRDRARILGAADTRTKLGLRDRAIMELMAATDLSPLQIVRLNLEDVSEGLATVTVRFRKVMVPPHVRQILRRYLDEVRLLYLRDSKERAFFLTLRRGRRIAYPTVSTIRRRLMAASGVKACAILGRIGK